MLNSLEVGGTCAHGRVLSATHKAETVLGFPVLAGNHSEVLALLIERITHGPQTHVVTLNPEMVISANKDLAIKKLHNTADLFVADGVGIEWAAVHAGIKGVQRYPGVDLAYNVLEYLGEVKGSVFLLGAKPGIATEAGLRLTEKIPGLKISGSHSGYFSEDTQAEVVNQIIIAKPDVLLVGMGSPKQESFISLNKVEMGVPLMIGVGGSLEVFAGQTKRAPGIFRRLGLEWIYRSMIDLSRIKRLSFLPRFIWLVLNRKKRGTI